MDPRNVPKAQRLGPGFTISFSPIYTCKSPHPCENALNPLPGDEEQASGTLSTPAQDALLRHTPKGTQQ